MILWHSILFFKFLHPLLMPVHDGQGIGHLAPVWRGQAFPPSPSLWTSGMANSFPAMQAVMNTPSLSGRGCLDMPGCTPGCSSTLRPRSGTLIPGGSHPEQHQGQGCTRAPGWMMTRRCSASGPGSSLLWRWRKRLSRRVSRIEVALRCSSRAFGS